MQDHTVPAAGRAAPATTDYDLVIAARSGDEQAFAQLVDRFGAQLSGMCWRYLRDAHLVEDVVQETFLRLFATLHRVDGGFNVSAWIHRIALNLCLDECRRRTRQTDWQDGGRCADSAAAEVVDPDRSARPDEASEIAHTRELMRAAAQQLPIRQRTVLVLRDVRGISQEDAAAELGISPPAVQSILFRARERFRTEYVALALPSGGSATCATVAFTLEHVALRGLRRDRFGVVCRHLFACSECGSRFGRALIENGRASAPGGAARRAAGHFTAGAADHLDVALRRRGRDPEAGNERAAEDGEPVRAVADHPAFDARRLVFEEAADAGERVGRLVRLHPEGKRHGAAGRKIHGEHPHRADPLTRRALSRTATS